MYRVVHESPDIIMPVNNPDTGLWLELDLPIYQLLILCTPGVIIPDMLVFVYVLSYVVVTGSTLSCEFDRLTG